MSCKIKSITISIHGVDIQSLNYVFLVPSLLPIQVVTGDLHWQNLVSE